MAGHRRRLYVIVWIRAVNQVTPLAGRRDGAEIAMRCIRLCAIRHDEFVIGMNARPRPIRGSGCLAGAARLTPE
jgi:hypothetical protein